MSIKFGQFATGFNEGLATVSITFTVESDDDYLLALVGSDLASSISSVVLDPGGPDEAAFALDHSVEATERPDFAELWRLLDADLPSAGTYTVEVTAAEAADFLRLAVQGLKGMAQQGSEVTDGASANFNLAGSSSVNITPLTDGSLVIDQLTLRRGDAAPTPGANQTQLYALDTGPGRTGGSYQIVDPAAQVTMSWTWTTDSNMAHAVAAFAPADTGGKTASGSTSVSGAGSVQASGQKSASTDLTIAGGGILSLAGAMVATGSLAVSGGGDGAPAGSKTASGSLAVSGGGAVACSGQKAAGGAPAVSGGGAAVPAGAKSTAAGTSVSGGGAVATSGTSAEVASGSTAVTGGGAVTPSGAKTGVGGPTVAGGGVVQLDGVTVRFGDAPVTAGGGPSGDGAKLAQGQTSVSGGGDVSPSGGPPPGGPDTHSPGPYTEKRKREYLQQAGLPYF